jgi:hypothetical protein
MLAAVAALICAGVVLMALDNDEEPAPIGYSWATFATHAEWQREVTRARSVPRDPNSRLPLQQPCSARLVFDARDPLIAAARLILTGYRGAETSTRQVLYDGPVAGEIVLSLPVHAAPDAMWLVSEGRAFIEDTRQMTSWHSMNIFEFTCDGRPLTITLLNEPDMEGTGGDLQIDRGVLSE